MQLPSLPEAWLFDLDGTLVASHAAWTAATAEAARVHHIPLTGRHFRECMCKTFSEVLRTLGVDAAEIACAVQTRDRVLPDFLRDMLRWEPGAEEVLAALKGKRSAIVTNSHNLPFNTIDAILRLRERVETVVTWDDVQGRGKPKPDPVLLALERLGVAPQRALLIGDHANDRDAAHEAGAHFLLVKGESTSADLLHEYTISSLHELLPLLR